MKTTKKQLTIFTIRLIKEIVRQGSNTQITYRKGATCIWFYDGEILKEGVYLYDYDNLKTNKDKFKKAILKISGMVK